MNYRLLNIREKKIKSISIIDHWVNYKERFYRNKKRYYQMKFG